MKHCNTKNLAAEHLSALNDIKSKIFSGSHIKRSFFSDRDIETIISLVYRDLLKREPSQSCINSWLEPIREGQSIYAFYESIKYSEEARLKSTKNLQSNTSLENYVVDSYEFFLNRIPSPSDINNWVKGINSGVVSLESLVFTLYEEAKKDTSIEKKTHHPAEKLVNIMGTNKFISLDEWALLREKAKKIHINQYTQDANPLKNSFALKKTASRKVSAICSLFKGGDFIETFMRNITSQKGFDDYCELIIVDANSPEAEYKIINKFKRNHSNIVYIRTETRIPIYEAWNLAIKNSSGDYITNTNVDDYRHYDSLITQASYLDNLDFADIVYQDFYYSMEFNLEYNEIQKIGLKSALPPITNLNILSFNSPHNAPMWRRSLHDAVGYFDESFLTAGDYEFWCRCIVAKKNFFKINYPHVVYYNNPRGLSTSSDSKGVIEANKVTRMHGKSLLGSAFLASNSEFCSMLSEALEINFYSDTNDKYVSAQQAIRALSKNRDK